MKSIASVVDRPVDRVSVAEPQREVFSVGPFHADVINLREYQPGAALGWRFFQDRTYQTKELMIPANVRTQIPDDGRGMQAQAWGTDSRGWLNPLNGRLYPDDAGDQFIYQLNLTFNPTINNTPYLIDFDIGTPNRVFNQRRTLSEGAGNAVPDSFLLLSLSSQNMKANGGAFYITPRADLYISKISIKASKVYSGRAR